MGQGPYHRNLQRMVCRTTNRVFVGVPPCPRSFSCSLDRLICATVIFILDRNRDYQHLNLTYATNVVIFATVIRFCPKPLKLCAVETHTSIVARMLSNLLSKTRQEIEFIRPMVEERFAKMEEFGEDWDMPVCVPTLPWSFSHYGVELQNDMLMWLMRGGEGVERSVEGLARRLLLVNFTAVHTTSQASDNTLIPKSTLTSIVGAHASIVSSPLPS